MSQISPLSTYFLKLYRYNFWANMEVAKQAIPHFSSNAYIAETFSHVVNAQFIWTGRISPQNPTPFKVRQIQNTMDLEKNILEISLWWKKYLETITEDELQRKISYTNSFGESFTSTIQDVVAHLVNHSSYHRGQVAKELRILGENPTNTDYITYCRLLEAGSIKDSF